MEVWSIGHSNLEMDQFSDLLLKHNITAIADVRTAPFSKRAPWFSQPELKSELGWNGISYAFLGIELGGRPASQSLFSHGVADYKAMARTQQFKAGIGRLLKGAEHYRIAMLCSEGDPLHCHRCLLVARALADLDVKTLHILKSGRLESQSEAEDRLLREEHLDALDMLTPNERRIDEAYERRTLQVAYAPSRAKSATYGEV